MSSKIAEGLWSEIRAGRHVVAIGMVPFPLAGAHGLSVARVSCDDAASDVFEEARVVVSRLLGLDRPSSERAVASAGRTFLGENEAPLQSDLIALCNELADAAEGRAALIIDAVDSADSETVETLAAILVDPALRLPFVLTWHEEPDEDTARILEIVRIAGGDQTIARATRTETAPFAWSRLSSDVLGVLRAAAVVGPRFDARIVAALLEVPVGGVLARLQQARDAGAPLADEGEGVFGLRRDVVAALRDGTTRSWAEHLHARLAALLAGAGVPTSSPARTRTASVAGAPSQLRAAAEHLVDAGDHEAAVTRFLAAAADLSERGDATRAFEALERAEAELGKVPHSASKRPLESRLLVERARAEWAGAGHQAGHSLEQALRLIDRAAATIDRSAPPSLVGDLVSVLAAIAYDIGEPALAQRAMHELHAASGALAAAGAPLQAARLLNDDAALRMRFGATERATELLQQARAMLMRLAEPAGVGVEVVRELATTEHLLSRLPLHSEPGAVSKEALSNAIEHAQRAQHLYQQCGGTRAATRALETMGRLEIRAGDLENAQRHLLDALAAEQQSGDASGLARSSDALAELFALDGRIDEALSLVETSAALNIQRGAFAALAFNRRTLGRLRRAAAERLDDASAKDTSARLEALERAISGAFSAVPPSSSQPIPARRAPPPPRMPKLAGALR